MSRIVLRLTKSYKNLNAGEQAGFEPDEAEHIIKNGGGVKVDTGASASQAAHQAPQVKTEKR